VKSNLSEAGFPDIDDLSNLTAEEARDKLMELKGIGRYSAAIVVSERGFSVDVWSAKIFSILLKGIEPTDPRKVIPEIQKLATERWGKWTGHAFVYILNDLEKISNRIGVNLMKPSFVMSLTMKPISSICPASIIFGFSDIPCFRQMTLPILSCVNSPNSSR
jgi:hypothetical protein